MRLLSRSRSRSRKLPPGDLSPRNRAMVATLDWKLVRVVDLPLDFKKALAQHQKPHLDLADLERYMGKNTRMGIVQIPMLVLIVQTMSDPAMSRDFSSFEEYHRDYRKDEIVPRHKRTWPVILSGQDWKNHTLIDGWHRFNRYYQAGKKIVPAMWYADE